MPCTTLRSRHTGNSQAFQVIHDGAQLAWQDHPLDTAQAVGKESQRARSRYTRVELAQRTGGGIARVGKFLIAFFPLLAIELFEVRLEDQDFTPHFKQLWRIHRMKPQRNGLDRAQIGGHILAGVAVASRRTLNQDPVFIDQANRQAVEFGVHRIFHLFDTEPLPHAPVECRHFFILERIVEGKHGHSVGQLGKFGEGRGANAPGGGIGRGKQRMFRLQSLQFAEQLVILGIRDFRLIQNVIQVVVPLDFPAQKMGASSEILRNNHLGKQP